MYRRGTIGFDFDFNILTAFIRLGRAGPDRGRVPSILLLFDFLLFDFKLNGYNIYGLKNHDSTFTAISSPASRRSVPTLWMCGSSIALPMSAL